MKTLVQFAKDESGATAIEKQDGGCPAISNPGGLRSRSGHNGHFVFQPKFRSHVPLPVDPSSDYF